MLENGEEIIGWDDEDNPITRPLPELKSCVRCGETAHWEDEVDELLILCGNPECGEWLATEYFDSVEEAAERWNWRPVEERLLKDMEKVNKIMEANTILLSKLMDEIAQLQAQLRWN
jgi:hypothetical protein